MLGGYMGRKHDPEPGYEVFWKGFEKLQCMRTALGLEESNPEFFAGDTPNCTVVT